MRIIDYIDLFVNYPINVNGLAMLNKQTSDTKKDVLIGLRATLELEVLLASDGTLLC